jgi:hypothetical protein
VFTACAVVTVLIAAMSGASAFAKLKRLPPIVEGLVEKLRVPESALPRLAALEIAGAAGALVGLAVAPLGIAATLGLVLYFAGAMITHVVRGDAPGIVRPLPFLVLAVAALVLRIMTM